MLQKRIFLLFLPFPLFAQIEKISLKVYGLACSFCAYGMEKKLRANPAIISLSISLEKGEVVVNLHKNSQIDFHTLKETIQSAGFTLKKIIIYAKGKIYPQGKKYFFQTSSYPKALLIRNSQLLRQHTQPFLAEIIASFSLEKEELFLLEYKK